MADKTNVQRPEGPAQSEDGPTYAHSGAVFETGARRSSLKPRFDLIPHVFLVRVAHRFGMGVPQYGEHNYKKGLPFDDTFNHIIDHLYAYKERRKEYLRQLELQEIDPAKVSLLEYVLCKGEDGDDLAAAAWGIAAIMYLEHAGRLK